MGSYHTKTGKTRNYIVTRTYKALDPDIYLFSDDLSSCGGSVWMNGDEGRATVVFPFRGYLFVSKVAFTSYILLRYYESYDYDCMIQNLTKWLYRANLCLQVQSMDWNAPVSQHHHDLPGGL